MASVVALPPRARLDPSWLPLLRELGELKRIRSAGRAGTIADRLFADGWAALVGGEPAPTVALRVTADALAATRLGDLDAEKLDELDVDAARVRAIRQAALTEVAGPVDSALRRDLADALERKFQAGRSAPGFVTLLAEQPRAGVTCPGKPRLMLQPPENHAEHCLIVAVYTVLFAPLYRADPGIAFLAAMAHHLHSAAMPDSGYAGEVLLGDDLPLVMAAARACALAELPGVLHAPIEHALALIADDVAPEAQAFHAADAIDRVIEIEQHVRAREVTMQHVLVDYGLVHDGPVKAFHDRVLAEVGLA